MKTVFLCFIVLVFGSCNTSKHAGKDVRKAHKNFPAVTANFCAETYPPIIKTIADTVTIDSLVIVECPDSTIITEVITHNDTIRTVTVKREKVYVNVPVPVIKITKEKESNSELQACEENAKLERDKSDKEIKKQTKWKDRWFWAAMVLLAIHVFRIIIKR